MTRQRGMIEQLAGGWRARYWERKNQREARTFPTKAEARVWLESSLDLLEIRRAAAFLPELLGQIKINSTGCWEWQGHLSDGYGKFRRGERRGVYVHRLMLEILGTPAPPRSHVHHTCENRRCINPRHLEPLTPAEHRRRHRKKAVA